jgi:hypothetical protein
MAKRASDAAAKKLKERPSPLLAEFGPEVFATRRVLSGARQRCTNPASAAYTDYGGRGIEFRFPRLRDGVEWILRNLGPRPSPAHSLDRVDNNRHYEPGNLRWATRSEQARNKRTYRCSETGERIRRLRAAREDLTYETIRMWIKQGMTDEEILNRRKYARPGI